MSGRVARHWADYRAKVVPQNAHPIQLAETRQAFYAGAIALFSEIVNGLSPEEESTEADLAMLDDIKREFDEWGAELLSAAETLERARTGSRQQ